MPWPPIHHQVCYEDFLSATVNFDKLTIQEHRLVAAFKHFDQDGVGAITRDDLARTILSDHVTDGVLDKILTDFGGERNGKVCAPLEIYPGYFAAAVYLPRPSAPSMHVLSLPVSCVRCCGWRAVPQICYEGFRTMMCDKEFVAVRAAARESAK